MAIRAQDVQPWLGTCRLRFVVECHEEIDSTNSEAARRAKQGAPEGTVILAERQTAGRGRLGRAWFSPPAGNLYCSVLLRPNVRPEVLPALTLAVGLATAGAIANWISQGVGIQWPNDVLVRGRKVSGILTEFVPAAAGPGAVIVGIGVNLNGRRDDFPPELAERATSVYLETGGEVDRAAFCGQLLLRLDRRYSQFLLSGFQDMLAEWQQWDVLRGKQVRVREGVRIVEGRAEGVGPQGHLLVRTERGVSEIVAGEATILNGGGT